MERLSRIAVLRPLDRTLWIGPVAFFLAACAWSMLDVEYESDTWIGLAAGRHILEQLDWSRFGETFPRLDPFSYTFYRQPWFNQNWLSNLGYYWIYHRLGPSAVVYVTWAMVVCIHALVLTAVYWRTRSWLAAWLAAGLVGIGGRDFLEPRAAIVGLLCTALLWALICAIEGQGERRRWWPIVPILPLLWFWANAHGGFVFAYGMIGLYCGCWAAARVLGKPGPAASGKQILAIGAAAAAAFAITILAGPFGIERFTHVGKVASDTPFRSVSEFLPAFIHVADRYPPMWRFWWMLALTAGGLLVLWLAGRTAGRSGSHGAPDANAPRWSFFDLALVAACLAMTLWARRFAPLLYVVSAPVLAIWVLRLAVPLAPRFRGRGVGALKLAAVVAALVTGWFTWTAVRRDLIERYADYPATRLLDRARGERTLREAVRFLDENRLRVNVLADYGEAALMMFYAPRARVFIDPRGDQVYSAPHLMQYFAATSARDPGELHGILDGTGTEAVLVQRIARRTALHNTLLASAHWVLVYLNPEYSLFLRHDSAALARLGILTREHRDWQPTRGGMLTPDGQASRAMVLLNTPQPDLELALELLASAVNRNIYLGGLFYPTVARLLAKVTGRAAANAYIEAQTARVTADPKLGTRERSALLSSLVEARNGLARAGNGWAVLPDDPL